MPLSLLTLLAGWLLLGRAFLAAAAILSVLPVAQVARTALRLRGRLGRGDAWLYAGACMVGKLPECGGAAAYIVGRRSERAVP